MSRFVRRPWGWYLTIFDQKNFKVKLLKFKKGKSCSMQRHLVREELWCFLRGSGEMYLSEFNYSKNVRMQLNKGNHCLVPVKTWHQFTANEDTIVLEIQRGESCLETDIERKA